ncbi:hypothetical protein HFO56_03185 [Rhizobium laguerreae]|uniref:hypothetical protein n=1 Tax=Rhizobium laguerreae TaxID=1076926 RepID=UPI001C9196F8|nr:hypothetical protein [Rhizobium laguerreae]MBY3151391.1 hypothetical protein [Rhizobium laguerreae]
MKTAIAMIISLLLAATTANAACDQSTDVASNCGDEFRSAAQNTFGSGSDTEKAKNVGEAVGNCIKCGAETVSDMMRNFGDDNNNKSSSGQ